MNSSRFWNLRYPVAAGLAVLALFVGVTLFVPEKASATVLVARHEVCAGCAITAKDVVSRAVSPAALPAEHFEDVAAVVGKTAAVGLSAGTVLQPSLLIENAVKELRPGEVAFALEVTDPAVAGFANAGQAVEVWGAGALDGNTLLASHARVLGTQNVKESFLGTGNSAAIAFLAAPEDEARRVIAAKSESELSFVIRK